MINFIRIENIPSSLSEFHLILGDYTNIFNFLKRCTCHFGSHILIERLFAELSALAHVLNQIYNYFYLYLLQISIGVWKIFFFQIESHLFKLD